VEVSVKRIYNLALEGKLKYFPPHVPLHLLLVYLISIQCWNLGLQSHRRRK